MMPRVNAAEVQARRRLVASLWLRGVRPSAIAQQLNTPETTIRRDVLAIRDELAEANRADLETSRDRSVAVLRVVQQEAWTLYTKIASPAATNKVGALNTIIAAEERIARLQGTLSPDVQQHMTVALVGDLAQTLARLRGEGVPPAVVDGRAVPTHDSPRLSAAE